MNFLEIAHTDCVCAPVKRNEIGTILMPFIEHNEIKMKWLVRPMYFIGEYFDKHTLEWINIVQVKDMRKFAKSETKKTL